MRKNLIKTVVCAFAILFSEGAFASEFGVFNIGEITEKSKVMKSLNGQKDEKMKAILNSVEAKRKEFSKVESDLKAKQKEFEKKDAELKAKASMLSEDAKKSFMEEVAKFQRDVIEFEKSYAKFQKDVMDFDKSTAEKVSKLEKAYMEALAKVQRDYLDGAVKKVGKDKGLDLVFNSQMTVVIDNGMDITEEVIDELNDRVTEIELQVK